MSDTRGGPPGRGPGASGVHTPNPYVAPRLSGPRPTGSPGTSFAHGQYRGPASPDTSPREAPPTAASAPVRRPLGRGLRQLSTFLLPVGLLLVAAAIGSDALTERDKPPAPAAGLVLDARVKEIIPFGPVDVIALHPPAKPRNVITTDAKVSKGDHIWAAVDIDGNAEEIVVQPSWPRHRRTVGIVGAVMVSLGLVAEITYRIKRGRRFT